MSQHQPAPAAVDKNPYDDIKLDLKSIPEYIQEDIALTVLECVREFLRQPGGREFLDAKITAEKPQTKGAKNG